MAPAWQYNAAPPPMGPATSMSAPPRGPVANHVNPAASSTVPPPPPSSAAYSPAPPAQLSHSATQPPGPRMPPISAHGYTQPVQYSLHRIRGHMIASVCLSVISISLMFKIDLPFAFTHANGKSQLDFSDLCPSRTIGADLLSTMVTVKVAANRRID
ncbi:hypothetical protein GBF38_019714 [Nibea albiflora]|uniref:Uncharacterized protein n=1 Tax=Nibea albiflora TaxID=240163 RepID=A0ACB7F1Y6_NIBAL|nr:hypothetical protein GBF38_019714 [Nibea albiflora]